MLTNPYESEFTASGSINADGSFSGDYSVSYLALRNAATSALLTPATAKALVGSAKVYVKSDRGDFSTGKFRLAAGTGATGCPAADLKPVASGDRAGQREAALTSATGTSALEVDVGSRHFPRRRVPSSAGPGCTLSMDVTENAKLEASSPPGDFKAIKAQKFTADVEVTMAGSTVPARFARKTLGGAAAGEIRRDGTTVQLPYLTTRAGYMQRVKLTNRSTKPANFWIESVSTADGAGPTSRSTASTPMNVAAGDRASVAAGDLVDFGANGTEGAATLSISAPSANVSVASVLTNLASNSTDTMLVEPEAVAPLPPPPAVADVVTAYNCSIRTIEPVNPAVPNSHTRPCRQRTGVAACDSTQCCNYPGAGRGTCVSTSAPDCQATAGDPAHNDGRCQFK